MNNSLRGRDYINIHDLSSEDFRYLIDLAWNLKAQKKSGVDQRYFPGKNVLANFEWGSTRTRCAFETSCNDLGMGFTYLTNSHMGDCETVKDAMRVFNGMYDLIVYRAQKDEQFLYDVADLVDIPVINALTLGDHPTQMLADALTMEEQWGGLRTSRGKKMAFVGNCAGAPVWYGRLCAMLDMDFLAIGPDGGWVPFEIELFWDSNTPEEPASALARARVDAAAVAATIRITLAGRTTGGQQVGKRLALCIQHAALRINVKPTLRVEQRAGHLDGIERRLQRALKGALFRRFWVILAASRRHIIQCCYQF